MLIRRILLVAVGTLVSLFAIAVGVGVGTDSANWTAGLIPGLLILTLGWIFVAKLSLANGRSLVKDPDKALGDVTDTGQ